MQNEQKGQSFLHDDGKITFMEVPTTAKLLLRLTIGKRRMPPPPDLDASEKTVNWKSFSSFHSKKTDHKCRKRQCSSSCLKSEETGIVLGDLRAFDMAKHAAQEYNLAAGTTSVKEFIFPTNF